MRVAYRGGLAVAAVLAVVAMAPPVSAHGNATHVVRPGQSIQAAVDAARPGDTVLVSGGTYRENVDITTDGITLRGRGARLEPPATSAPGSCSNLFGIPDNPFGICVLGQIDPETFQVTRPVRGVRIEGFTIGEFADTGIFTFGTDGLVVKRNDVAGGDGDFAYSILFLASSHGRILYNRVHGAGGAGIYLGASPDAQAVIAHNVSFDSGSLGIMVRDSVGGVVEHNVTYDNCMGIGFVDGLAAGTSKLWTARGNVVRRNNAVCPGEPVVSGVGVLLAGSHEITLDRNVIVENRPASGEVPYSGGVVLTSGAIFGGTELATGNVVTRNVVRGNAPVDLNQNDVGPGNRFSRNSCRSSLPAGLC